MIKFLKAVEYLVLTSITVILYLIMYNAPTEELMALSLVPLIVWGWILQIKLVEDFGAYL